MVDFLLLNRSMAASLDLACLITETEIGEEEANAFYRLALKNDFSHYNLHLGRSVI